MSTDKRVLAFVAHPDDAEILCAGTLVKLYQEGWEVHIATATAGDCGTLTLSPEEISQERKQEATNAAALINAQYHCLEELDGKVCYNESTLDKVYSLFREVCPTIVLTHTELDYMMDHVVVSQLARAASFVYSAANVSKTPSRHEATVPHLYYCDSVGGTDIYGKPLPYSSYVDISGEMTLKTQMLLCHKSQDEWLREYHGVDEYVSSMQAQCRQRGDECKAQYAEGFIQHLGHGYPTDDILAKLFNQNEEICHAV
ncbi:MAG: PIG-L family deacetylase [Lentisphaeraceae bacterium]|nr:PIG-L family deacetylase [Lentisphaeraceae bacterium]